ncbi:MAG: HAMP domain-containing histidine kinase [Methylibium sp.]|nr:HAMP domain-containing histidine kinase [Methylibium sp.]
METWGKGRADMTVRFKLALTIFVTGALTALGVIATVLIAFERFEHETAYRRGDAFLGRVAGMYHDLTERQASDPVEFEAFLRQLLLFEPETQLYLLDATGLVLASTAHTPLPGGFKVALAPVMKAISQTRPPYVMGDDPQRMDSAAVIAARPVSRADGARGAAPAGYLYLVVHRDALPEGRLAAWGDTLAQPALIAIVGVVALATLLAAWIIAVVTRPLHQLGAAVDAVSREGLGAPSPDSEALLLAPARVNDEFGQLARGFGAMVQRLRSQWETLRRLDHFRREGVSNLSHDLRSPLTATTTCLETLEARWGGDTARTEDGRLLQVALRNTRNAARLVQSLGELAQLDEPEFKLRTEVINVGGLLDDISLRFAPRAGERGVRLQTQPPSATPAPVVELDVALFERAVANLVDNALKFSGAGSLVTLAASKREGAVAVSVTDTGPGIAADEVPHLSTASTRAAAASPPPRARAAVGWAWRSSSASPSCMAAACAWSAASAQAPR